MRPLRGRQQGDPKAAGSRSRGVKGLSDFAAEAHRRAFLTFWEKSAWLYDWPVSYWVSCTVYYVHTTTGRYLYLYILRVHLVCWSVPDGLRE